MNITSQSTLFIAFVVLLFTTIAVSDPHLDVPNAEGKVYYPPFEMQSVESLADEKESLWLQTGGSGIYTVTLDSLLVEETAPNQIGVSRPIEQLNTTEKVTSLIWQPTIDGGHAIGVQLTSPAAQAMRMGILVKQIHVEAELRFYSSDESEIVFISGATVRDTIQRNLASGDTEDIAWIYWSPVISGDTISVEIYLPPGIESSANRIAFPVISHIYQWRYQSRQQQPTDQDMSLHASPAPGYSLWCHNDLPCYSGWTLTGSATAHMIYTDNGGSYICSGTLMVDNDTSADTPYFLSAAHCISTQSTASSLETFWLYQNSACNIYSPSWTMLAGGATLLYKTDRTDTVFLRLNNPLPIVVLFSGWAAVIPNLFDNITGIHHPQGDVKKISFGYVEEYNSCTPTSEGTYTCQTTNSENATHFTSYSNIGSGLTEPGSSGSGIFRDLNQQLIGTLTGGQQPLCATSNKSQYGLFSFPYNQSLHQWLGSQSGDNTCGQDTAIIDNRTYLDTEYELCEGTQSVTAMTNVRIASGAIVRYKAPTVVLGIGFSVANGGEFQVTQ